ncbi:MAG: hypothetical protein G01um10143_672 [Parcubacteria group bacterium Gr01-1014_3]|nr:MAG: hypothetical protein G01um10143_672 [Parcubacteria group bacterium Gr01-1014_3]
MVDTSAYGSQILDLVAARETAVKKYTARDAAWKERQMTKEQRQAEEENEIQRAKVEILRIEARIMEVKELGGTRLENIRFVPLSICAMPVSVQSWYEIRTSWIRNPERMILAAFDRGNRRIDFAEKIDPTTQTRGFSVSISWD